MSGPISRADPKENAIEQLAHIRFPEKMRGGLDTNLNHREKFKQSLRRQPQQLLLAWLIRAREVDQLRLRTILDRNGDIT